MQEASDKRIRTIGHVVTDNHRWNESLLQTFFVEVTNAGFEDVHIVARAFKPNNARSRMRFVSEMIRKTGATSLVLPSLDHLGSSMTEIAKTLSDLRRLHPKLLVFCMEENLRFQEGLQDFPEQMLRLLSRTEDALTKKRRAYTVWLARASGIKWGRATFIDQDIREEVVRLKDEGLPTREIARRLPNISRASIQKILKDQMVAHSENES